ncbi:MAG: hypothetical protein AB8B61_06165 [Cyclobacteriaceae bacterium]
MVNKILFTDFKDYISLLFHNKISTDYVFYFLFTEDPRSSFFIRISSVLGLISQNNIWVISAYLSLFSFVSSWYLVKTLTRIYPSSTYSAALSLLIWPSAVLWTAGIQKETVAVSCLFFLTTVLLSVFIEKKRITLVQLALTILSSLVLWKVKYYYAGTFLVSACYFIFLQKTSKLSLSIRLVLLVGSSVSLFYVLKMMHPVLSPTNFLTYLYQAYSENISNSAVGNYVDYGLKENWLSFGKNAPYAFFNGLFRPFIWEANSVFQYFAAIENVVFYGIASSSLFYMIKQRTTLTHIVIACLFYVVILGVILPLSTPNFGSLLRYKSSYFPFLLYLLCSLIEMNWRKK